MIVNFLQLNAKDDKYQSLFS